MERGARKMRPARGRRGGGRAALVLGMIVLVCWTAGVGAAADPALTKLTSAASLMDLNATSIKKLVVELLENNIPKDQPRLIVMQKLPSAADMFAPKVCDGFPAVIARLSQFPSNNACFPSVPDIPKNDLSCSCLTGYDGPVTSWEFTLQAVGTFSTAFPPTLPKNATLPVSSLVIYGIPDGVQTLKITSVGSGVIPMELKQAPFPGIYTGLSIVQTTTRLRTLVLEGMDLSKVDIQKGFVPDTVENLTMSNCNLSTLPSVFLSGITSLTDLDVSNNHLQNVLEEITKDTCTVSSCKLKSINLSRNNVSSFPTNLLHFDTLRSLSLRDNHLGNYSVSADQFAQLQQFSSFEADSVDQAQCIKGKVQMVQSTSVCVLPDPKSGGSSMSGYLMYGIIGGCIVIAFIVFLVIRTCKKRRRGSSHDSKGEALESNFDNTLSYDDTPFSIDPTLLNDPIIITSRISYNDIRVANCVSKGGFGLVYSGVYNRRRVAIKKIRSDKSGDIKQIELFLKEICLIATLNHPRIVEFIGVAWDSLRNLCAVTEFMERGDLREVLHGLKLRKCALTWESNKMTIALQIAEGLTYLHSLTPKVIHRDLKSKNVLLNADMDAKLSDFGISRERRVDETHMTAGIGTSFWIAPEVLLGRDYDERADIFSYGVVLSEIDTDDYPYWNSTNPNAGSKAEQNVILQMVASGAMRPTFSKDCPKEILELSDLCLQADPEDRPTAAQICYLLQQYIRASNASSTGSSFMLMTA